MSSIDLINAVQQAIATGDEDELNQLASTLKAQPNLVPVSFLSRDIPWHTLTTYTHSQYGQS